MENKELNTMKKKSLFGFLSLGLFSSLLALFVYVPHALNERSIAFEEKSAKTKETIRQDLRSSLITSFNDKEDLFCDGKVVSSLNGWEIKGDFYIVNQNESKYVTIDNCTSLKTIGFQRVYGEVLNKW